MGDLDDWIDVDEVLDKLRKKYGLSEAHVEYIRTDVDNACDLAGAAAHEELRQIEWDLDKSVCVLHVQ